MDRHTQGLKCLFTRARCKWGKPHASWSRKDSLPNGSGYWLSSLVWQKAPPPGRMKKCIHSTRLYWLQIILRYTTHSAGCVCQDHQIIFIGTRLCFGNAQALPMSSSTPLHYLTYSSSPPPPMSPPPLPETPIYHLPLTTSLPSLSSPPPPPLTHTAWKEENYSTSFKRENTCVKQMPWLTSDSFFLPWSTSINSRFATWTWRCVHSQPLMGVQLRKSQSLCCEGLSAQQLHPHNCNMIVGLVACEYTAVFYCVAWRNGCKAVCVCVCVLCVCVCVWGLLMEVVALV